MRARERLRIIERVETESGISSARSMLSAASTSQYSHLFSSFSLEHFFSFLLVPEHKQDIRAPVIDRVLVNKHAAAALLWGRASERIIAEASIV